MPTVKCEVVIVGGGPAGMSAALVLGRCRRNTLLFDNGRYRNAASHAVRGFLTRDGAPPEELRRIAREEVARYPSVVIREATVTAATRTANGFEIITDDEQIVHCRKLLIATGLVDRLPAVTGAEKLLGVCIFPCPYCDGWELRDTPLAAYARGDDGGARFALELTLWSRNLVLLSDGPPEISANYREKLSRHGVQLCEARITEFEGDERGIRIRLESGHMMERRALFFSVGCRQGSDLAEKLGCRVTRRGGLEVGPLETANVPGLYIAGDASRDALQAIVGAGEGSTAAIAINNSLIEEDLW
jgi:thioredoxin reductase